jgi:GTP:adenosylcobinamide-phosphate guanylyltransferase
MSILEERTQIIIPAAGFGSRFTQAGYRHSKPFIRVDPMGTVMLERALRDLPANCNDITVLLREEQADEYAEAIANPTNYRLRGVTPVFLKKPTEGAACTVRIALTLLNPLHPVMVLNSDQFFTWRSFPQERQTLAAFLSVIDAKPLLPNVAVLTFVAERGDNRWSYVVGSEVCGHYEFMPFDSIVEKDSSHSRYATCGVYWVRTAAELLLSIDREIAANNRVNGEFYLAPAVGNVPGMRAHMLVPQSFFMSVGTPELFEEWLANEGLDEFKRKISGEFLLSEMTRHNK